MPPLTAVLSLVSFTLSVYCKHFTTLLNSAASTRQNETLSRPKSSKHPCTAFKH